MERIIKNAKLAYIPYLIYLAYLHVLMRENPGQDGVLLYIGAIKKQGLAGFVVNHYESWSSRILVDTAIALVADHKILFSMVDIAMYLLLAWSISVILDKQDDAWFNWIIIGCIVAYPMEDMTSAGWMATLGNYIWPLALAMYALSGVARAYRGERLGILRYILYLIATLFATNMEQVSVVVFGFTLLFTLWELIKNRKFYLLSALMAVLSMGEIIFSLTCPGSITRLEQEKIKWNAHFDMYTTMDKLNIGLKYSLIRMFSFDYIFVLFTTILAILVIAKYRNAICGVIALIPALAAIFFRPFEDLNVTDWIFKAKQYGKIPHYDEFSGRTDYSLVYLFLFLLLCVLWGVTLLTQNYEMVMLQTLILGLGLASHLLMGFSPTIDGSGRRTMIFLDFSMILSLLMVLSGNENFLEEKQGLKKSVGILVGVFATIGVINAIMLDLVLI